MQSSSVDIKTKRLCRSTWLNWVEWRRVLKTKKLYTEIMNRGRREKCSTLLESLFRSWRTQPTQTPLNTSTRKENREIEDQKRSWFCIFRRNPDQLSINSFFNSDSIGDHQSPLLPICENRRRILRHGFCLLALRRILFAFRKALSDHYWGVCQADETEVLRLEAQTSLSLTHFG